MKKCSSYRTMSQKTPLNINKFQEIRNSLDRQNYKYHLDFSSIQLAEVMLNDIRRYLEESTKFKEDNSKLKLENENSNNYLKAFKSENNRLVKENNDLHRELLNYKKNLSNTNTSKSIQIKKFEEEKNDFKYLYTNSKEKIENLLKENEEIKIKLSTLLNKIYEGNLNESSLRKMFDTDENIRKVNNTLESNIDLGIHIKTRGITITDMANTNNDVTKDKLLNNYETIGKLNDSNTFKEAFEKTFKTITNTRYIENEIKIPNSLTISPLKKPLKNNQKSPIKSEKLNSQNLKYECEIKNYKEQISLLESEIKRLQMLIKFEPSSDNKEVLVNFLKAENKNLIEKYENQMEVLIMELKKFELKSEELSSRVQVYENHIPYVKKIEKNNKNSENIILQKEKIIVNLSKDIEKLTIEKDNLKSIINNYKENFIEKSFVYSSEKELHKLNENFISNQELIARQHLNIKELTANSNSTEKCLKEEIFKLKREISDNKKDITNLKMKIDELSSEKEELLKNTNLLHMNVLKKTDLINELKDQIEQISQQSIKNENDKIKLNNIIQNLESKVEIMKKEVLIKENEIDRLNNKNFVMEKQIQMLESKIHV